MRLAKEISACAVKRNLVQPVLLQVKVLPDPEKGGFTPEDARQSLEELLSLPGIKICGLMTITPLTDDREISQDAFTKLKALRAELAGRHGIALAELSMGMTDDWKEAVACGSTMVRIGRAIFQKPGEA
jgi:hypothetical protein